MVHRDRRELRIVPSALRRPMILEECFSYHLMNLMSVENVLIPEHKERLKFYKYTENEELYSQYLAQSVLFLIRIIEFA